MRYIRGTCAAIFLHFYFICPSHWSCTQPDSLSLPFLAFAVWSCWKPSLWWMLTKKLYIFKYYSKWGTSLAVFLPLSTNSNAWSSGRGFTRVRLTCMGVEPGTMAQYHPALIGLGSWSWKFMQIQIHYTVVQWTLNTEHWTVYSARSFPTADYKTKLDTLSSCHVFN